MGDFNFSFPEKMFGFSSSWPMRRSAMPGLSLNLRQKVYLKKWPGSALFLPFSRDFNFDFDSQGATLEADENQPYMMKSKFFTRESKDVVMGLSSGSGSALYSLNGEHVKLKRCGYRDWGISPQGATTSSFFGRNAQGEIYETSTTVPLGTLPLSSAVNEARSCQVLREQRLCVAYEPKGVFYIEENGSEFGAVLHKIESDLRMDEFILALLSPLLLELFESYRITFVPEDNRFVAVKLPWNVLNGSRAALLVEIGRTLGARYRELHASNYLRGFQNAWIGNEVIDKEGNISFVDLDETVISIPERYSEDASREQAHEVIAAKSNLYSFFAALGLRLFRTCGELLVTGFEEGYSSKSEGNGKLDAGVVSSVIKEHLEAFDSLSAFLFS